jgi:hypothetical protein
VTDIFGNISLVLVLREGQESMMVLGTMNRNRELILEITTDSDILWTLESRTSFKKCKRKRNTV